MKQLIKVSVIILGTLLFFNTNAFAQTKAEAFNAIQNNSNTLQEADKLFIEGSQTSDISLIRQAQAKLTLWLENNKNADKKLIAQALRARANVSVVLNEPNRAINDFKESIVYEPIGEVQLGICLLDKKQGDLADLQNCYDKAVKIFTDKQTPKTDANYLIARILSGDKAAITEYKHIVQSATGDEQLTYEMAAKAYLDEGVYKQIIEKH